MIHKVSRIFQPMNIIPKNAQIKNKDITSKSQRLLLELGLIKQANPGNFHFLSLGVRAMEKLTHLIDREMNKIGAQKIIFPTLTDAKLWKTTGRLDENNSEIFTIKDRHNKNYILSPTYEEAAADLLASVSPISYKEFPLRLYQITSKYRDEIKPRFGLMRARQFVMKDLYTFDLDVDAARKSYEDVCSSYDTIFENLGVNFVKVLGTSGMMGGSLSHEYHYVAEIGEDSLLRCLSCGYASNIELSGPEKCPNCGNTRSLQITRGIEVGHTFLLGEKYSKPLKANYVSQNGKLTTLQMGSYGLGISRILSAAIEVLSLEQEIRWPPLIAPFSVLIIPPKDGSKEEQNILDMPEKLYKLLETVNGLEGDILMDDRKHLTIGRRFLDGKRIGYPYIIVIGTKAMDQQPLLELIDLVENKQVFLNELQILNYFKEKFPN